MKKAIMSDRNLSREEAIRSFEDRCRCEAERPKTEEQRQKAKEIQGKCKAHFRKKYGNMLER